MNPRNSYEEEPILNNSTDRLEEGIEKADMNEFDDFLNNYHPNRRVTYDPPKKKKEDEGFYLI